MHHCQSSVVVPHSPGSPSQFAEFTEVRTSQSASTVKCQIVHIPHRSDAAVHFAAHSKALKSTLTTDFDVLLDWSCYPFLLIRSGTLHICFTNLLFFTLDDF